MLLILFDGLQPFDLVNPDLAHLRAFAASGQTALLNTSVAGHKNKISAVLTLALGALNPSEATDAEVYEDDEPVERTTAANVYRRRIGPLVESQMTCPLPGARPIVHIGWAPIMRRGLDDKLIGSVLARAGKSSFLPMRLSDAAGEGDRVIGLFGVDGRGIGRCGRLRADTRDIQIAVLLQALTSTEENLAVSLSAGPGESREAALARLDRILAALIENHTLEVCRIMLVSPHPPPAADGSWDRLSLLVMSGSGIAPGLASSPTTRTAGLIANIDVAPTLLSWVGVRIPATMTGHVIPDRSGHGPDLSALLRMDRKVTVNGHALDPVFVLLGGIAAVIVGAGLMSRFLGRSARPAAMGMLFLMTMPLAMLIVAPVNAATVGVLASVTLATMAVAGGAIWLVCERGSRNSIERAPLAVALVTVAVVVADTFLGGQMVKFSLFSSYQLQGIRFYGIGNEYMSVLIGFTLLIAFLGRLGAFPSALLFSFVTFVVGWPALGANAGGLIAATVAFTAGWQQLRGKRISARLLVFSSIAGVGLAIVFALLDRQLTGGGASHLGGAMSAAGERGWSYLADIAVRKMAMNLRILVHPAVITAITGVLIIVSSGNRVQQGAWRRLAEKHPAWHAGFAPAACGAAAGFLFNDSGVVVALFLMGAFLATGLYLLFLDDPSPGLSPAESGTLKSSSVEC